MFIVRIMIVMGIGNDTALLPQQYQTNIGVKRHKVGLEMRKVEVKWCKILNLPFLYRLGSNLGFRYILK